MERGMNKVVIVTRRTRLEELIYKYNTMEQARFYIEHMGVDFQDYVKEDAVYRNAVDDIIRTCDNYVRVQRIDRTYLPNMIFGEGDIVLAVGQDGLVANVLKYLDDQPLIGVNPDPKRWDGVLLPFEVGDVARILQKTLKGVQAVKRITMAEAVSKDGQSLLAVNDFFVGCRSHVSARYEIEWQGRKENQSSSGIIVSTGLGATGWYKSIMTEVAAIAKYFNCGQIPHGPISWDAGKLMFVVREPYPSIATQAEVVFGCVEKKDEIKVVSNMPTGGVVFSDGMEEDNLDFNSGNEVTIRVADREGKLVCDCG